MRYWLAGIFGTLIVGTVLVYLDVTLAGSCLVAAGLIGLRLAATKARQNLSDRELQQTVARMQAKKPQRRHPTQSLSPAVTIMIYALGQQDLTTRQSEKISHAAKAFLRTVDISPEEVAQHDQTAAQLISQSFIRRYRQQIDEDRARLLLASCITLSRDESADAQVQQRLELIASGLGLDWSAGDVHN